MAVDGEIASSLRRELSCDLRGQVICPDDLGYDAARAVFNGIIDRHPCPSRYVGVATASRGTLSVTGQSCFPCPE